MPSYARVSKPPGPLTISAVEQFVVEGGARLEGSVSVLGAKNAVLKHLVAILLAPGTHQITYVPRILDVEIMGQVLAHVGAECTFDGSAVTIEVPIPPVPSKYNVKTPLVPIISYSKT